MMVLGGKMCPGAHSDAGLVELFPLIVGGSLPVMCQALELLTSHTQLKRDRPALPPSSSQAGSYLHRSWPVSALTCFKYLRTPSSDLKFKARE